jgi:hypothetical protein
MPDQRIQLLLDMGVSRENVHAVIDELDRLDASAKSAAGGVDKLDASAKKAGGGVAGMGQSMLQTGRVVQDFSQGGIGGILNNIEGLTMALGQGPGLAGALTVAGVAFMLLKKPVQELFEAMGEGGPAMKVVNQALDEGKKRIEDISREIEHLQTLRPKGEAEQQRRVREIIAEGPEKQIEAGMAAAMKQAGQGAQMTEKDKQDEAFLRPFPADLARFRARLNERLDKETEAMARQLMAEAETNPAALERAAGLAEAAPGGLPRGFGRQLRDATPRAMRNREVAEAEEAASEGVREIEEAERKAQARLNQQVQEAEAAAAQGVHEIHQAEARTRGAAAGGATREAAARQARDKLPMPPAAQLRQGDRQLWQFEAATIEARAMQRGGATRPEQERLRRLAEKLGKDMPSYEQVQMMQAQVQQGLVSNQATFAQKMDMANRAIRELQQINRNINSSPMPSGLPR